MTAFARKRGGTMVGLDFKLKGSESLARKIESDVRDPGNAGRTPAEIGADLFDVNRYAMTLPHEKYASSAQSALDDLRKQGYKAKGQELLEPIGRRPLPGDQRPVDSAGWPAVGASVPHA